MRRERARQALLDAFDGRNFITGTVSGLFHGKDGFRVDVNGVICRLPFDEVVLEDRVVRSYSDMIGSQVTCRVTRLEYPTDIVLSERDAARGWLALLRHYRQGELLEMEAREGRDGGLTAYTEGYGFHVPARNVAYSWVSRNSGHILVKVTAYDRANNQVTLSEHAALAELFNNGQAVGQVFRGTVTSVVHFGAFVNFGLGVDGLLHRSEIVWKRDWEVDIERELSVGQHLDVVITSVAEDSENPRRLRIGLSAKRVAWWSARPTFSEGAVVPGVVMEIGRNEVTTLRLPGPIVGRAPRSAIVGYNREGARRGNVRDVLVEGDVAPFKIVKIRDDLLEFEVSYRDGRAVTSTAGSWEFDQRGRVVALPESVRSLFPTETEALGARYSARRTEAELSRRAGAD